jgi:acetylornithine deacetylase/succinyl-diaminopimelate desuccinylase-like protein
MLRRDHVEPSSDLWLAANVCEEGLGNLRGMREVVSRFGADVRGYLVLEGTALGHVYHRAVGARRYRVSLHTSGGHSWSDYGQPSAIHEMARLITKITTVPVPEHPRTTVNIGVASGGTGVNVLAADARFELDVRSEDVETLGALTRQVESIARTAQKPGVSVDMEVIGERPAGQIPADHPLVSQAEACLAEQGLKAVLMSGSTDANVPLSLGYPSIVLGITSGGGAHTSHEYIDMPPVEN